MAKIIAKWAKNINDGNPFWFLKSRTQLYIDKLEQEIENLSIQVCELEKLYTEEHVYNIELEKLCEQPQKELLQRDKIIDELMQRLKQMGVEITEKVERVPYFGNDVDMNYFVKLITIDIPAFRWARRVVSAEPSAGFYGGEGHPYPTYRNKDCKDE